MRSAQKSNRSRGRGNRKSGGNSVNRVYDSAGPEGKVRGTPQQIIDKYISLARDAQTSGDRVTAENFLQHAEHYQRLLITAAGAQENVRREQSELSDEGPDEQPVMGAATPAPADDVVAAAPEETPSQQQPRRSNGRQRKPAAAAPEISGMAMIDAGTDEDADALLVATDPLPAKPAAKSNGTDGAAAPSPEGGPVSSQSDA